MQKRNKEYEKTLLKTAETYRAIDYLRLGEQQYCILDHSRYSCLLPLDSSAIYKSDESAKKAIANYLALLKIDPADIESRYLLILAHMTLGSYPELIPNDLVIKNPLFDVPQKRMVIDKAMEKKLPRLAWRAG